MYIWRHYVLRVSCECVDAGGWFSFRTLLLQHCYAIRVFKIEVLCIVIVRSVYLPTTLCSILRMRPAHIKLI